VAGEYTEEEVERLRGVEEEVMRVVGETSCGGG